MGSSRNFRHSFYFGIVVFYLCQQYQCHDLALSIAHDSHNIIVAGTNDIDMAYAVEQLIAQGGGITLVKEKEVIGHMPMVVGGIMSDKNGEWVKDKLT